MSRAIAPVLLLLLALASLGAVFAVHHIEAGGGPLGEPYATLYASPNGDGSRDVVRLRMNEHQGTRIDVEVVDPEGTHVRELASGRRARGTTVLEWDGLDDGGSRVADGEYEFRIRREGDRRVYAPARPTIVDTRPPRLALDPCTHSSGRRWSCTMVTESFARIRSGIELPNSISDQPNLRLYSKQRRAARQPAGNLVRWIVGFTLPAGIELAEIAFWSTDRAGNTRTVHARASSFPAPKVLNSEMAVITRTDRP